MHRAFLAFIACSLLAATTALAADPPVQTEATAKTAGPTGPAVRAADAVAAVKAGLASSDPAAVADALAKVREASLRRGRGFAGHSALDVLFDAKRFDDAEQIALEAILKQPTDADPRRRGLHL